MFGSTVSPSRARKTSAGSRPLWRRLLSFKLILALIVWVAASIAVFVGLKKFNVILPRAYNGSFPFKVTVGEEELMMGPTNVFADTFWNTVKTSSGIVAFTGGGSSAQAGGSTYRFTGTNLSSMRQDPATPVLRPGAPGAWDDKGAWLNSVHKIDERHWVGWYHGEGKQSAATKFNSIKAMGFAETFDAGLTWTKPTNGKPTNEVVTGDSSLPLIERSYGDAKVMRIGDYFYMFISAPKSYKTEIARSRVADLGKPGTWYKYYNGTFSQPGVGGKSSAPDPDIHFAQGFLSFNTYLNRYIAIRARGREGFYLSYSPFGASEASVLKWDRFPVDLIPAVSSDTDPKVDPWIIEGADRKQIYTYASIIGLDGDADRSGQEFYLYYMKVYENDSLLNQRYLMRRKIRVDKDNLANDYPAKVALVQYQQASGKQDIRSSIDLPRPSEGYTRKEAFGYLLSYPEPNAKELHECYIGIWKEYMPTSLTTTPTTVLSRCHADGEKHIRRMGWALANKTTLATQPLYLCWNETRTDHYASRYSDCKYGGGTSVLAGYIIPMPGQAVIPPQTAAQPVTPKPATPKPATPKPATPKPATPVPAPTLTTDQKLVQQYFRALIGVVPALTDSKYSATLNTLNSQGCKAAIKSIMADSRFIQGKKVSLSNLDYIKLIYQVTMSRTPADAEAKPWADRLQAGNLTRDSIVDELYRHSEPTNACNSRKLL